MTTTYALRFIVDNGDRKRGEFVSKKPPYTKSTPDLINAHRYKQLSRAYEYGYWPLVNEIVEVDENNGILLVVKIVESRDANITSVR